MYSSLVPDVFFPLHIKSLHHNKVTKGFKQILERSHCLTISLLMKLCYANVQPKQKILLTKRQAWGWGGAGRVCLY